MFRKVNIRLTLLFTAVCTVILLIMSFCYVLINYKSIYDNSFIRFNNDVNSFCNDFSGMNIINYDSLLEIQKNYNYDFYFYDNGKPLRFTEETKSAKDKKMIDDVRKYYSDELNKLSFSGISQYKTSIYRNGRHKLFTGIISICGENGTTEIYVINDMMNEKTQIQELVFKFSIIIMMTIIILFVFSYFFTGKLLSPIRKNNEQQTLFIAAASHEIRNPVNTIISALDAMENADDEQRNHFAGIAKKEGQRLIFLTEDLLTLAKSDSKNFPIVSKPTELDTLLLDCYEAFIAPAQEKKIRLYIKLPDESVEPVNVDPDRIKQVITIILSNAVSYTPDAGLIEIDYSAHPNKHTITISDNGSGISDEDKQHIFERFYRSDRSRESRSHFGLGLAIAKEIITLHKGTIQVKDNTYGGASFIIDIPAK